MLGGVADGRTCAWEVCGRSLLSREGERPRDFRRRLYCGRLCAQRARFTPPGLHRADAFWRLVEVGEADACWPYTGPTTAMGYGRFTYLGLRELAHRVAYRYGIGPIPDGEDVLHRCDCPPCCNPHHLFTGTQSDNSTDMWSKGRGWAQRGVVPRRRRS